MKGSFNVPEAAEYMGITERLLRQAIAAGEVRVFRFTERGDLRVSRRAADDYITTLEDRHAVATDARTVATRRPRASSLRTRAIKKREEIRYE